jgi:hypothetical protein
MLVEQRPVRLVRRFVPADLERRTVAAATVLRWQKSSDTCHPGGPEEAPARQRPRRPQGGMERCTERGCALRRARAVAAALSDLHRRSGRRFPRRSAPGSARDPERGAHPARRSRPLRGAHEPGRRRTRRCAPNPPRSCLTSRRVALASARGMRRGWPVRRPARRRDPPRRCRRGRRQRGCPRVSRRRPR